ncbi:hypothetical protein [Cryptosporangium phraense]|uniref:DUF2637 domain-containing protein n=1 Tax=Cryptosporangium phraense TaxID=2593070 RepID=A0A545AVD8_9ACTN|nr:hypothetical protein [Cryptosporangium phraense]TQS45302.1 hypothetical protein FL583_09390 [Cryptosporangium phraense]
MIASFWVAQGWVKVAHDWLGIAGPEGYLLFGLFECVIVFLVRHAYRARLARDPTTALWAAIWTLTFISVATQVGHALDSDHPGSALVYGPASLITVGLWQLKIFQGSREALRARGLLAPPEPGFPMRFRRRFRSLVKRAVLVASYEGIDKPEVALERARQLYPDTALPWERAQAVAALRTEQGLGKSVMISRKKAATMLAVREAEVFRVRGERLQADDAHAEALRLATEAADVRVAAERDARQAAEAQVADLTAELERGVAELNAATANARAQFTTEIEQLRAILTRESALREAAQLRSKQLEDDLAAARESAERTAERLTSAALSGNRSGGSRRGGRNDQRDAEGAKPPATEDTGTHRIVPLRTGEERVAAMLAHTTDPDYRWTAREVRSVAGAGGENWRDYVTAWSSQLNEIDQADKQRAGA